MRVRSGRRRLLRRLVEEEQHARDEPRLVWRIEGRLQRYLVLVARDLRAL